MADISELAKNRGRFSPANVSRPKGTIDVPTSVGKRREFQPDEEIERRRQEFSRTLQDVSGVDTAVDPNTGQRSIVPRPTARNIPVQDLRRQALELNRFTQTRRIQDELAEVAAQYEDLDEDPLVVRNFALTNMVNRQRTPFTTSLPVGSSLAELNEEMEQYLLNQPPEDLDPSAQMRGQDVAFIAAGAMIPLLGGASLVSAAGAALSVPVGTIAGVVTAAMVGEAIDGDEEGFIRAREEAIQMGLYEDDGLVGRIGRSALATEEASGAGQIAGLTADIAAGGPLAFARGSTKLLSVAGRGSKNLGRSLVRLEDSADITKVQKGKQGAFYKRQAAVHAAPLTNSGTMLNAMFQEDKARQLAIALEHSNIPGVAALLRTVGGRAALASMPVEKRGVVYAMHLVEADQNTDIAMSMVLSIGKNSEAVFGKFDELGRIAEPGKLKGKGVGDLLEQATPGPRGSIDFANMTDLQRDWTRRYRALEDRIVEIAKAEGIDLNLIETENGLDFASRQWMGVFNPVKNEWFDLRGIGIRSNVRGSSGRGKGSYEKSRFFETQEEGFAAGFKAVPQEEVLRMKVRSLYRKIAEKRFVDGVLSEVAWRSTAVDDALKLQAATAKKIADAFDKGERIIQEALRGGSPAGASRAQIRRAARISEDLAGTLSNLTEEFGPNPDSPRIFYRGTGGSGTPVKDLQLGRATYFSPSKQTAQEFGGNVETAAINVAEDYLFDLSGSLRSVTRNTAKADVIKELTNDLFTEADEFDDIGEIYFAHAARFSTEETNSVLKKHGIQAIRSVDPIEEIAVLDRKVIVPVKELREIRKTTKKQAKLSATLLQNMSDIADDFPDLADDLDRALAISPDEAIVAIRKALTESTDLTRITPDQFRDALLSVRRSRNAQRFAPSTAGRTTVRDADITSRISPGTNTAEQTDAAQRAVSRDPLFPDREARPITGGPDRLGGTRARTPVYKEPEPIDLGKRSITPGEMKAVLRQLNKDNKLTNTMLSRIYSNAWELDNADRTDALRAVLKRIQDLRPTAKSARDTAKKIAEESRKWNRVAHIAKDADGNIKAFERTLPDDPSKVILFDSPKEADDFAKAFNDAIALGTPDEPGALQTISKASAVVRLFQLGGDASSMFIHLIMLAGNRPDIWGKALIGYTKGMFDSNYRNKLLASNAELLNRNPQVLLSSSGNEFTEALARGGYLSAGRGKVIGTANKALAPFQRGVEASLDVAGINLLKSMEHMATSPAERAQLASYINEIRGLSNSSTLGISSKQRMQENIVFLAPRYNRAIGALVFDALRGTGSSVRHPLSLRTVFTGGNSGAVALRQEQARNALIRGIAGLSGVAIAISLTKQAMDGEKLSLEKAAQHLNPANPEFFTWQIAGQNVGPGSKIRSLAVFAARSVTKPSSLTEGGFSMEELMKNPAFKFLRSNFGPAVSKPLDIINGRNFIGEPTRDNMLNFTNNVVAEGLMPLWLQSVLLEGSGLTGLARGEDIPGRLQRGVADFVGMRSYPTPAFAKFQYEAERAIEPKKQWFSTPEAWQKAHDSWRSGGFSWEDQPPAMKAHAKTALGELWQEAERERAQRGLLEEGLVEWDRLRTEQVNKLQRINDAYLRGEVSLERIRTAYQEYGRALADNWNAVTTNPRYAHTFAELDKERPDGTPEEILYKRYLDIVHDPSLNDEINGRFNFEERDARLELFKAAIGHDAWLAVQSTNEERLADLPPVFARYVKQDRETLKDYFNIGKNIFGGTPFLWSMIQEYRNATREEQQRMREGNSLLDFALKTINNLERQMRFSRPAIDRLLVSYYPKTYTSVARQAI